MKKILISACLLDHPVRYNGTAKPVAHPSLEQWKDEGRLVTICPEVMAGFSVPRPPAEISAAKTGREVLAGFAQVLEAAGGDVTSLYVAGARAALALALEYGCRFAILTNGSPSCGSSFVYDGSFSGKTHAGMGVTTALLQQHRIEVFSETEIDVLASRL